MPTPWNQLDRPQTTPADELLEMHEALLEVDQAWRIVRVNTNQERLSMKPRSRTLGRSLWEAFPELANPETEYCRNCRRCMRDRVPVQIQDYYAPLDMWTGVTAYPSEAARHRRNIRHP